MYNCTYDMIYTCVSHISIFDTHLRYIADLITKGRGDYGLKHFCFLINVKVFRVQIFHGRFNITIYLDPDDKGGTYLTSCYYYYYDMLSIIYY